jgi:pimeloyl-ACP methyl ester carboxylesterase
MLLDVPLERLRVEDHRVRFETSGEDRVAFDGFRRGDSLVGTARPPDIPAAAPLASDTMRFSLRRVTRGVVALPYDRQEVRFDGAGAQLAGTAYLPLAGRPTPGIVLLHGSTTNARDWYRFHADRFARAGIAALVFDKRGSGASSGDLDQASIADLVADAAAAVTLLASRPEVNSKRVGLWGFSQGGLLAPLVVQERPQVGFVVAISSPGVSLGEAAAFQDSLRVLSRGYTEEAAQAAALQRALEAWVRSGDGATALAARLASAASTPWRRFTGIPTRLPSEADRRGWYWAGRALDPLAAWKSVRKPVLLVYGERDDLLPAALSAARIAAAASSAPNSDVTTHLFPKANHTLKVLPRADLREDWDWPRSAAGYPDSVLLWVRRRSLNR